MPKPAYVKVNHIFENSMHKCALVCDETANIYYKINDGAFVLYGSPFVVSDKDVITYFAEAGGAQSVNHTHVYYIESTYPVYMTAYPSNQDGNVITKDNIADSKKVEIKLNAETDFAGSNVYVAFYNGDTLVEAYAQPKDIVKGTNTVTVDFIENPDIDMSKVNCIKIFVWDGKLCPCAEVYIQD